MAKCNVCGNSGVLLKVNEAGICLNCATKQLTELQARITPEFVDAEKTGVILLERKKELTAIDLKLTERTIKTEQLSNEIKQLEKQLLVVSDAVTLESFALYTPRYDFVTSAEYKNKLDSIRNDQKQMIRDKNAVIYNENWTVNGSKAEGKKLLNDMEKLFLRSFNNECDAAVADVKFSNFDRCKERILNAFDTINKLGRVNSMSLTFQYRQSKLEELSLAFEYQQKKEEEREAIRALREQQREDAKLAKEIEEARKEGEKEKQHYQQALEKLHQQMATCANDEDRVALLAKQDELVNHLDDINEKLEDIDYRQSNQKAGYVYVISNIGAFGENIYKIGMTRRLDPMERIFELGDASVPFLFDIHAMIFSDDAPKLEAALHKAFENRRLNLVNNRREYFNVTLDEIKKIVFTNHDKTVEFFDEPEAQQYRESLRLRDQK